MRGPHCCVRACAWYLSHISVSSSLVFRMRVWEPTHLFSFCCLSWCASVSLVVIARTSLVNCRSDYMNHASSRNACCWPAEDGSWAGTDFARFGNHISSDESVDDSDCSMPEHEKEAWLEYQCAIGALENIDGRDDDCQYHETSSGCDAAGPGIVLLRSDGTVVLHGKCTGWRRCVPVS